MTKRWIAYPVVLLLEWLFISGLWRAYNWFATKPFLLPRKLWLFELRHVFLLLFILALFCLVLVMIKKRASWFGLARPDNAGLTATFQLLAFVFPVALIGRLAVPGFDAWYADRVGLLGWSLAATAIISTILAVVKEEFIERIMQRLLLERFSPLIVSLAIALQFGSAHFFRDPLAYGIASMASVIPAGFILALLYARTKNFWLALIFHQAFNLVVILQIILHAKGDTVGESMLWAVWGLAWMLTLKPAWKFLRGSTVGPKAKAQIVDWVFLSVFGIILPVAYLLLYT